MVFIDDHRDEYGVEPICEVLPIAPSTYYAYKAREADPTLRSARAQSDERCRVEIQRVWDENRHVYGAEKVWKQLNREGFTVARCTVARLMRAMGLRGAVRGRRVRRRCTPTAAERPFDLVERDFIAERPNQLWVSDLTYVATWRGFVYVAFVIDVFSRRIVGWRVSTRSERPRARRAGAGALRPRTRRRPPRPPQRPGRARRIQLVVATPLRRDCDEHSERRSDKRGERPMDSPAPAGRAAGASAAFWVAIAAGLSSEDAARSWRLPGTSGSDGSDTPAACHLPPSPSSPPPSGRYFLFAEREEIALLRAQGHGVREIARRIGRAASTISRELRRNAATRSGGFVYRATTAQWHADRAARRPKPTKLATNAPLRDYVQDRLGGAVASPMGRRPPVRT